MSKSDHNIFKITGPCSQSWDEMTGNDQVRVCKHCEKAVHNISTMRRKDAVRLVSRSEGNICLRYKVVPNSDLPQFARRVSTLLSQAGVGAGVLTASIALSGGIYAQDDRPPVTIQTVNAASPDSPQATISGTVTDPNGAVVPYALVSAWCDQTGLYRTTTASAEGSYEFHDIPPGTYKIKIEAGGFDNKEFAAVEIGDGMTVVRDAQLGVQTVAEVVEVGTSAKDGTSAMVMGATSATFSSIRNALVEAVVENDLDEVKARVMMQARVNVRDSKIFDGITPLHAAVENGNIEIVRYLLENGAKVNMRDYKKRTPLMMMDDDATPEMLALLLQYGAKTSLVDKDGSTALDHLAGFDNAEVARQLVAYGLSPNRLNKSGRTALMVAAESDSSETLEVLLQGGANPNIRARDGKTAWDLAKTDAVRSLLETYGGGARSGGLSAVTTR